MGCGKGGNARRQTGLNWVGSRRNLGNEEVDPVAMVQARSDPLNFKLPTPSSPWKYVTQNYGACPRRAIGCVRAYAEVRINNFYSFPVFP